MAKVGISLAISSSWILIVPSMNLPQVSFHLRSKARISRQYYGTDSRWTEILAANRDILRDERSLVIGRVIRIP